MQYEHRDGCTYRIDDEGSRDKLANYTAEIVEETRYVNGRDTETTLTIQGEQCQPDKDGKPQIVKLEPVTIKAEAFTGMQWPMMQWGVRAITFPVTGAKDDLRTAIQLKSNPKIKTVFRHTGWTEIAGKAAYIHGGGAIHAKGNDPTVTVQLPPELSRYNLAQGQAKTVKEAIQATLNLVKLPPPGVGWPLLAATVAPLHGPVDFAVHVTGRTGTYKSELMSLFQSHYGPEMDARHLPGSWSSTANAIEAQAFLAANAPYVLDDFVPAGTSSQQRAYQQNADKIIRSQGNQAGRARLTDTSSLQTAMYPRGIIMSTGEDTPEGHSVRARMMIMELTPGDIEAKKLTKCQQQRHLYSETIAKYVQHLAGNPVEIKPLADANRDNCLDVGHARTPAMCGRLQASVGHFLDWCATQGVKTDGMKAEAHKAILAAAGRQKEYLETADPCDQFTAALRQIFAANTGHVRTLNGGIPKGCSQLGWSQVADSDSDMPTYKSHGPCIGWVSWNNDDFMLEINVGFAAVKKTTGSDIPLTKQTMLKRLKDAGFLKRTDETRQRNSVRVTAEQHQRQVIVLSLAKVLDTQERQPGDDDNEDREDD